MSYGSATRRASLLRWFAQRAAVVVALGCICWTRVASGQDTPLISGGAGFFNNTNGGNTDYLPIVEPLIAAPVGNDLLIESRAALFEQFVPKTGGQHGYDHKHFVGLTYLQADYLAAPHATVVAGSFLIPFNTYNERLSPVWINNFQDAPLISVLGTLGSGTGLGGMLRGSAFSNATASGDYAAYYSVRSGNEQFSADRSFGGRGTLYLHDQRIELGISYNRVLQNTHENFYGGHLWWQPVGTALHIRGEAARGHHAQGYWVEVDYRLQRFGGPESRTGRIEPVFRMQQTFRRDTIVSDGLPFSNIQRADFGLNYYLPHETRILSSYSRQFSASGLPSNNRNIWQTGIVYRFLFPTWRGR